MASDKIASPCLASEAAQKISSCMAVRSKEGSEVVVFVGVWWGNL